MPTSTYNSTAVHLDPPRAPSAYAYLYSYSYSYWCIGIAPSDLEVVALTRGKSRNRPMAPTYVLAVDHGQREIVLSVRGTKAFGDAITITHFRPEPFLSG